MRISRIAAAMFTVGAPLPCMLPLCQSSERVSEPNAPPLVFFLLYYTAGLWRSGCFNSPVASHLVFPRERSRETNAYKCGSRCPLQLASVLRTSPRTFVVHAACFFPFGRAAHTLCNGHQFAVRSDTPVSGFPLWPILQSTFTQHTAPSFIPVRSTALVPST